MISERIMRGQYVSKAECLEHAEEIGRLFEVYPSAMRAMEESERKMRDCLCDWDVNWEGSRVVRFPRAECPVHRGEDQE